MSKRLHAGHILNAISWFHTSSGAICSSQGYPKQNVCIELVEYKITTHTSRTRVIVGFNLLECGVRVFVQSVKRCITSQMQKCDNWAMNKQAASRCEFVRCLRLCTVFIDRA